MSNYSHKLAADVAYFVRAQRSKKCKMLFDTTLATATLNYFTSH